MYRNRILPMLLAATVATAGVTTPTPAHAVEWMSQNYNPSYADVETSPGETVRIPLNGTYPVGTTFEIPGSPAGWDLTVDADGTVTARPIGQFPGAYVQNYVVITYPDRTVDYALFGVRVVRPSVSLAESLQLAWGDATVAAGGTVVLRPSVELPAGTKLAAPTGSGGWQVNADEATGEVKVTAPAGARPGSSLGITLGLVFPDGSARQYSSRITVVKGTAASTTPPAPTTTTAAAVTTTAPSTTTTAAPAPAPDPLFYVDTPVPAGDRVTVFLNGNLPEGSRVVGPNRKHNGWTLNTNEESGAITFTAPADAAPGYRLVANVTVVFPDGSKRDLAATAYVPGADTGGTAAPTPITTTPSTTPASKPNPAEVTIDDATIKAGETIVVTPKGLPAGARVFVTEETRGGWTIGREGDTGIRITAATGMRPGSVLRINAAIQFADYSSVNRTFDTTVIRGTAATEPAQLEFSDVSLAPGRSTTLTPAGSVPRGTTFKVGDVQSGWSASINRTSGRLTIRAPRTPGATATIPVIAQFSDGSTQTFTVAVRTTGTVLTTSAPTSTPAPNPAPAPSDAGVTAAKVIGGIAAAAGLLGLLGGIFGGFIPFF